VEGTLAAASEEARVDEAFQMVAQGGRGQIDVSLDVARRRPADARLDDETEDRETYRMAERSELLCMTVHFRCHAILLTNSKKRANTISTILEVCVLLADLASLLPEAGMETTEKVRVRTRVRSAYAKVAQGASGCSVGCCGTEGAGSMAMGYTKEDLES